MFQKLFFTTVILILSIQAFSQNNIIKDNNYPFLLSNPVSVRSDISPFFNSDVSGYRYFESFEDTIPYYHFPPWDWSRKDIKDSIHTWDMNAGHHSGRYCAGIQPNIYGEGEDWLLTGNITGIINEDSLVFWVKKINEATGVYDSLDVLISTTDSSVESFTTRLCNIDMSTMSTFNWIRYAYSLKDFVGNTIIIAFRHYENFGCGCLLDDVEIKKNSYEKDVGTRAVWAPTSFPKTMYYVPVSYGIQNYGDTVANFYDSLIIYNHDTIVLSNVEWISNFGAGQFSYYTKNLYFPYSSQTYKLKNRTDFTGDAVGPNDSMTYGLLIRNDSNYYAWDDGNADDYFGLSGGVPGYFGNIYNITFRDTMTAVSIQWGGIPGTLKGMNIELWNAVMGRPSSLIKTIKNNLTLENPDSYQWRTYPCDTAVLNIGKYFILIHQTESSFGNTIMGADNGAGYTAANYPYGTSLISSDGSTWYDLGSYGYHDIFTIRAVFDSVSNMNFDSSAVFQADTSIVPSNSFNNKIIGIKIFTHGQINPKILTSLVLNTSGTTNASSNLSKAKIWNTGNNSSFDTNKFFGEQSNPNGSFTISKAGGDTLLQGVNYFWLTYDITNSAVTGDSIDGECNFLVISSGGYVPYPQAPVGYRKVYSLYASLPYNQYFDANWINKNSTEDVPDVHWVNDPAYGLNSWRREDRGLTAGWYSLAGAVTPYSVHSACFNSTWSGGLDGIMDLHVNFSSSLPKKLTFMYQNTSGSDILQVLLSTNGGTNFSSSLLTEGVSTSWKSETINFGSISSSQCIIRFKATGDNGADDIGIDNIKVMDLRSMVYDSCTAFQNDTIHTPVGSINTKIIGVKIYTEGNTSPFATTAFNFNTSGTTSPSTDIRNAKLWYTGISETFDTVNQFSSTVGTPNGAFSITGARDLEEGTNYFWLTYDITPGATTGDFIDAGCDNITVNSSTKVPVVTSPAGHREIVGSMSGTYTIGLTLFNEITEKNLVPEKKKRTVTKEITEKLISDGEAAKHPEIINRDVKKYKKDIEEEYTILTKNGKNYDGALFTTVSKIKLEEFGIKTDDKYDISGHYATLTAAVNDLNLRGVTGTVYLLLTDNTYSGETYPITFNSIPGASGTNQIFIQPNYGINPQFIGDNATTLFDFNGVQYVTLNGEASSGPFTNIKIYNINSSGSALRFTNNTSNNVVEYCNIFSNNTISGSIDFLYGSSGCNNNKLLLDDIGGLPPDYPVYGIYMNGTGGSNCSNNSISRCNIKDFNTAGIHIETGYSNTSIQENLIHEVHYQNTYYLAGLNIINSYGKTEISSNNIYDLNVIGPYGIIRGIAYLMWDAVSTDTMFVSNNSITLGGNTTESGTDITALFNNSNSDANLYFCNNSIYIGGDAVTNGNSYGIYEFTDHHSVYYNNIIFNVRSNGTGTGNHYGIFVRYNYIFSGIISNYNDIYVNGIGGVFGFDGYGKMNGSKSNKSSLSAWVSATGLDKNSYSGNPGFMDAPDGWLLPDSTNVNCWNSFGKGMPILTVTNDHLGLPRSTSVANGPNCIGDYEFTPAIAPPIATPSGLPSSGGMTSYSQSERRLLEITWGSIKNEKLNIKNQKEKANNQILLTDNRSEAQIRRGGLSTKPDALPTTVNVQYYSGVTPPDTLGMPSPKFGKGFWKVDTDCDPADPVNIKVYWGDQELGDISDTSKLILAMYDMKNRVWLSFERGYSGSGVSIRDNLNKTITVNGLPRIDSVCFALTSSNAPLKRYLLDLTILIQGLYDEVNPGYMVADTVSVVLRDSANGWIQADSTAVALNTNGAGQFYSSKVNTGNNYYIVIKHRNALETWSALGNKQISNVTGVLTYDFTTGSSQAYGENLILKSTKYCIYSGDVNHDGTVDATDQSDIFNDGELGAGGDWRATDLNGDDFVDASDQTIAFNNGEVGVFVAIPPDAPWYLKTSKEELVKKKSDMIKTAKKAERVR
jgi:hypothetical protein